MNQQRDEDDEKLIECQNTHLLASDPQYPVSTSYSLTYIHIRNFFGDADLLSRFVCGDGKRDIRLDQAAPLWTMGHEGVFV